LLKATNRLSRWERYGRCFSEVRAGNCSALQMAQRIGIFLFWKIRRKLVGEYARGRNEATPVESLNLQSGEWIEVKSLKSILETLNEAGHNRGLYFSPDMRLLCGGSTGSRDGSTRSLWMELERCDNSAIPCAWKGHCADAPTSASEGVHAAKSSIGGRFGFADLERHLLCVPPPRVSLEVNP